MKRFTFSFIAILLAAIAPHAARAADAPAGGPYATFTAGAQAQRGLFTLWRKDEHVYIDLTTDQLDKDFLETVVPGNGFGGNNIVWGNTDHLPAMLVRFHRVTGGNIAIVWPNTSFVAPGSPSGTEAVQRNFPQSVVGIGKIVAEGSGHIVFDASPLFEDVLNLEHIINGSLGTTPGASYRLDSGRTYFGQSKAFPENVLIHVEQLWATNEPHVAPDTAPDSRNVQMDVAYNFSCSCRTTMGIPRASPTIASGSTTTSISTSRTILRPTDTCATWFAGIFVPATRLNFHPRRIRWFST